MISRPFTIIALVAIAPRLATLPVSRRERAAPLLLRSVMILTPPPPAELAAPLINPLPAMLFPTAIPPPKAAPVALLPLLESRRLLLSAVIAREPSPLLLQATWDTVAPNVAPALRVALAQAVPTEIGSTLLLPPRLPTPRALNLFVAFPASLPFNATARVLRLWLSRMANAPAAPLVIIWIPVLLLQLWLVVLAFRTPRALLRPARTPALAPFLKPRFPVLVLLTMLPVVVRRLLTAVVRPRAPFLVPISLALPRLSNIPATRPLLPDRLLAASPIPLVLDFRPGATIILPLLIIAAVLAALLARAAPARPNLPPREMMTVPPVELVRADRPALLLAATPTESLRLRPILPVPASLVPLVSRLKLLFAVELPITDPVIRRSRLLAVV